MYRYLDRSVTDLPHAERLLVWGMRSWVRAIAGGRCPCAALVPGFRGWGVGAAIGDFSTAMHLLNAEGQASLRFPPPCAPRLNDDEARLLALFDAGFHGSDAALRKLADQLVQPQAVWHLITAVERVTVMLAGTGHRA